MIKSQKNASVATVVAERDIDLVVYQQEEQAIQVRLSVENKTIMAAHGKARKNRLGDILAYCNHVHNHKRECVAGAVLVINTSSTYVNPDGFARGLKRPAFKMEKVVTDTVKLFEKIPLRYGPNESNELPEGLTVVLIEYDGTNPARLVGDLPSPSLESQLYYGNFVRRMCGTYQARFGVSTRCTEASSSQSRLRASPW